MSVFATTTLSVAGIGEVGTVAEAVLTRSNIFEMTQAAEDAVLRPQDIGTFPHDLRAALASRIATQADDAKLAAYYAKFAGIFADLADPLNNGGPEHGTLIAFVDKAANATKDITATDISDLQKAGVLDADIVKLCELVAFVAFQVRVTAGLRLMQGRTS
jgi:uncharacterized protein YciW